MVLVLVVFNNGRDLFGVSTNVLARPNIVNIGALLSVSSDIGKVAKVAIEAAIRDINADQNVLVGTKLQLAMHDVNYSGFLAITEALRFMQTDTVAIIGPQSSETVHVISQVANELLVPLLSYSATDPTMSSLQYPFFIQTSHNDLYQMAAVADIVSFYEWREVIVIYSDDYHGRNGIAALGDKLAERRCKVSFKAALRPSATRAEITSLLIQVALTESRIFVVHTFTDWGLQVLSVARYLGMINSGYVWIATNWLSTVLDTHSPLQADVLDDIQGVLTLRMHTPDSQLKRTFVSRWKNMSRGTDLDNGPFGLNVYGLYAYDTVWVLAHAIENFFKKEGKISFSNDSRLSSMHQGRLNLNALSIFDAGDLLRRCVLQVDMVGVTGHVKFTPGRDLVHPAYEVINVIGTGYQKVGYWSNYSGLSVVPPEKLYSKPANYSSSNQRLQNVIWPGQTTHKPRGWAFPSRGRYLRIGVPNRVSFREFISVKSEEMITGYCIDVFIAALNLLPYALPYKLVPYGDGLSNPSCTELVRLITTGVSILTVYDGAIGDIAIVTNRTKLVDFTQPYIESGLVVVAPVRKLNTNAWAFLRPFTPMMWGVTAMFFLVIGIVVWSLEHRSNDEFRGPPRKQIMTILWFSFSTWFFSHRENTVSSLGRLVLIIWLFVVLIINSSYTASLTSILTVQKLSSSVKGIDTLITSNDPIGYQHGSFARNYLMDEFGIHESRLIALNSPEEYVKALKDGPAKGGVAAMVDERAYLELFLSTRCEFSIIGQEFTRNGWGFAFPHDSPLAVDMSNAILELSENGDLQKINDKWLSRSACSSQATELDVERLEFRSFSGLFMICGTACLLALFVYFFLVLRQFSRHSCNSKETQPQVSSRYSRSQHIKTFLSFVDKKEENVKHRSKRRQMKGSCSNNPDKARSIIMSNGRKSESESSSNKTPLTSDNQELLTIQAIRRCKLSGHGRSQIIREA
ncbi:hypothetical protein ACFE04_026483 [Oxalis oulophora]